MTNGMHGVNYNEDPMLNPAADVAMNPVAAAKVRDLLAACGQGDLVEMVLGEVAA